MNLGLSQSESGLCNSYQLPVMRSGWRGRLGELRSLLSWFLEEPWAASGRKLPAVSSVGAELVLGTGFGVAGRQGCRGEPGGEQSGGPVCTGPTGDCCMVEGMQLAQGEGETGKVG